MKYYFFLSICILATFFSSTALAQSPAGDLDKQINVEIIPQTPGPNEDTEVTIVSYVYDLSRSKISWYINDALKTSGIGQKTFNFTTGGVGSVSKVRYSITTPNGVVFGDTIPFSPGEVSLIWESLGYTPPFYKGKSLFSFEGTARIVAVPNIQAPNGTKYKPGELVYTWKRGSGTDTLASGYGKNVFYFNGDIIARPSEIQVEVTDLKNISHAEGSVTINAVQPELHVYEDNSSLGILFNKSITDRFNMLESEASFVAEPFYYNDPDKEGEYVWSVNGSDSEEKSRYITFRNTTGEEGHSDINIDLSNQVRIMQSANSAFSIYFGTKNESAISNMFNSVFGN